MSIVEPNAERVAQMIGWSGIAGDHDGNCWDVGVTSRGPVIEIVVEPYDDETCASAPDHKKTFRVTVEEVPTA